MANNFEIRFDGGLASTGQLHFYEYSRSQYAIARLITTIEHFRRTGEIAERINQKTYIDVIVSAPERGSFFEVVTIPTAKELASTFVSTGFEKLFYYIWNVISPRSEKTDESVLELAKIELKKEKERTKQSKQETERLSMLERIVAGQQANTKEALDIVEAQRKDLASSRVGSEIDIQRLNELMQTLSAELVRKEAVDEAAEELDNIPADKVIRLASRVRPMLAEAALPLRRSADKMELGTPKRRGVLGIVDKG